MDTVYHPDAFLCLDFALKQYTQEMINFLEIVLPGCWNVNAAHAYRKLLVKH